MENKNLYIIGGAMGVGKTTVCKQLKKLLPNCVMLDGDWCLNASPFVVNEETKQLRVDNITYLLNNFIACSCFINIVFCWVLDLQSTIEEILSKLNTKNCDVFNISLICTEQELTNRLQKDIDNNLRSSGVIERSLAKLPNYSKINSAKIDTTNKTINQVCEDIQNIRQTKR